MSNHDELVVTYWSNSSNTNEVDFVIQKENIIIPLEVKAGINLKAKSLKCFQEKYKIAKAWRFSAADYKDGPTITDYPLYATEVFQRPLNSVLDPSP